LKARAPLVQVPVSAGVGKSITTIEGWKKRASCIQCSSFLDAALPVAFCTPEMIMSSVALLHRTQSNSLKYPIPAREYLPLRTHPRIIDAVRQPQKRCKRSRERLNEQSFWNRSATNSVAPSITSNVRRDFSSPRAGIAVFAVRKIPPRCRNGSGRVFHSEELPRDHLLAARWRGRLGDGFTGKVEIARTSHVPGANHRR